MTDYYKRAPQRHQFPVPEERGTTVTGHTVADFTPSHSPRISQENAYAMLGLLKGIEKMFEMYGSGVLGAAIETAVRRLVKKMDEETR